MSLKPEVPSNDNSHGESEALKGLNFLEAAQVRSEQLLLHESLMNHPFVCQQGEALPGMVLPPVSSSASDFLEVIGGQNLVTVLQVKEEREVIISFEDWVQYFTSERASDELNCVSFDVHSSALAELVTLPEFVRNLDLCTRLFPEANDLTSPNDARISDNRPGQEINTKLLGYHGGGAYTSMALRLEMQAETTEFKSSISFGAPRNPNLDYRKTPFFCSMFTAGCYADFHITFGGASSFYHIISGQVWVYLVEPTPENLAKYEDWVAQNKMKHQFFGDLVPHCSKCELSPGASVYIPSGWIHGLFIYSDTILFGANFLTPQKLDAQLSVFAMEHRLAIPERLRFPYFEPILHKAILAVSEGYSQGKDASILLTKITRSDRERHAFMSFLHLFLAAHTGYTLFIQSIPSGQEQVKLDMDPNLLRTLPGLCQTFAHGALWSKVFPESDPACWKQSFEKELVQMQSILQRKRLFTQLGALGQAMSTVNNGQPSLAEDSVLSMLSELADTTSHNPILSVPKSSSSSDVSQTDSSQKVATKPVKKKSKVESTSSPSVTSLTAKSPLTQFEQLQCNKCMGFFTKKGIGPHRRYCNGEVKGTAIYRPGPTAGTHKLSCHRCGNLRKRTIPCTKCTNIFCRKCGDKMVQQYGPDIFTDGCPFCKSLCCCKADKSKPCTLKFHCYKKCHSATDNNNASIANKST